MSGPRPVARLIVAKGQPTVEGATIVVTACCDALLTHAVDASGGDPRFDLTAFFNAAGDAVLWCKCGNRLPDAKDWRP